MKVSIGHGFGAVMNQEGMVYTWGENTDGQLGTADYTSKQTPELLS